MKVTGELTGYKTWQLDKVVQGIVISIRLDMEQTKVFHETFVEVDGVTVFNGVIDASSDTGSGS